MDTVAVILIAVGVAALLLLIGGLAATRRRDAAGAADYSRHVAAADQALAQARAVRAGKAVLCEKPIDLDITRVDACRAAIGALTERVMLGFNRRFDPSFADIRARVQAGDDVVLLGLLERHERLVDGLLVHLVREVLREGATVQLVLAGAGDEPDADDGLLAAADGLDEVGGDGHWETCFSS